MYTNFKANSNMSPNSNHSSVSPEFPRASSPSARVAVLQVNVRSCGYPPAVVCDTWHNVSAAPDTIVPCHYSRTNSSLAITDLDPEADTRDLLTSLLVPIVICIISTLILLLLHCRPACCTLCHQDKDRWAWENKSSVLTLIMQCQLTGYRICQT